MPGRTSWPSDATGLLPSVTVADVNGDNRRDLVVANGGSHPVSVLIGIGNGLLQPKVDYPTGLGPSAVAVTDVNEDKIPDLVVANRGSHMVSVMIGTGNGTFQAAYHYPAGATPGPAAVADMNGDGKLDVIVPSAGTATVDVLLATCLPGPDRSGAGRDRRDLRDGAQPHAIPCTSSSNGHNTRGGTSGSASIEGTRGRHLARREARVATTGRPRRDPAPGRAQHVG